MRCNGCDREAALAFAFCPYCGAPTADQGPPQAPSKSAASPITFETGGTFYTPIESNWAGSRASSSAPAPWGQAGVEARAVLRLDADGLQLTPQLGWAAVVDDAGRQTDVTGSRRVRPGETILLGGARIVITGQDPAGNA